MKLVKDKKTLKKISKETGLKFHPKWLYCENSTENRFSRMRAFGCTVNGVEYRFTYVPGCFYPYLVKE